uniref:Pecanex-like protein n=1 Tax=Echinostoma caproni TaxID=27848 RepID=A0A183ATE9_9TREM
LGLSLSQMHQLITSTIRSEGIIQPMIHLVIGCHAGQVFEDSWASESEPSFAHWIEMLKAKADWTLELRRLTTGYTVSIDGELSVRRAFSSIDPQRNPDMIRTFHYVCDNRRVLCYPPGTSKLIT